MLCSILRRSTVRRDNQLGSRPRHAAGAPTAAEQQSDWLAELAPQLAAHDTGPGAQAEKSIG